jgi:DNA-binding MarR family transcriptional regulator
MSISRMKAYVPLAQIYSARVVLFHAGVAEKLGLNATDVKTLRLLGQESMTAGVLAEETGLTGAAVTALIDRLEAAGYVVRERGSEDRRRVTVRAVRRKVRELDRLYDGLQARMSKLLAHYNTAEFSAITDFLERSTRILTEEAAALRGKPKA